ncbi:histidine decarboxylase [Synechococcus sp. UW140]|uniref:histidine decarboxylase n=1 Tax=Synechococcus sp. UW140 TaxID=368503 RepID=UPI00260124DE|nr:histidine decarboxylase [Synechococcus sp. UW140]
MIYNPWEKYQQRFPLSDYASSRLNLLDTHILNSSEHYIGFPNSRILSNLALGEFLKYNINNIGDPFHPNSGINTCNFEQEVISFWSSALHLDPANAWGYITNGSTEGIMYGITQGRNRYEDAVLIFTEQSHYCLLKIAKLLRLPYRLVPSRSDGTLNPEALTNTLVALGGQPFIINLTVGTTFHGAIEYPQLVLELLEKLHLNEFHIHVDAALYGPMHCWIPEAPLFDFRLPIHTLSFSGHKFLGAPIPCGIVLGFRNRVVPFGGSAEYVNSMDTTLSSSRDGLSSILLWLVIQQIGAKGLTELANESLDAAFLLALRLEELGISAYCHEHSCIVVFPKPNKFLQKRWHLATLGDFAHIVTVPGVTTEMTEQFIEEFLESRSSPSELPGILFPSSLPTATLI